MKTPVPSSFLDPVWRYSVSQFLSLVIYTNVRFVESSKIYRVARRIAVKKKKRKKKKWPAALSAIDAPFDSTPDDCRRAIVAERTATAPDVRGQNRISFVHSPVRGVPIRGSIYFDVDSIRNPVRSIHRD